MHVRIFKYTYVCLYAFDVAYALYINKSALFCNRHVYVSNILVTKAPPLARFRSTGPVLKNMQSLKMARYRGKQVALRRYVHAFAVLYV